MAVARNKAGAILEGVVVAVILMLWAQDVESKNAEVRQLRHQLQDRRTEPQRPVEHNVLASGE